MYFVVFHTKGVGAPMLRRGIGEGVAFRRVCLNKHKPLKSIAGAASAHVTVGARGRKRDVLSNR
jgi:hypothetical protein